MSDKLHWRRCHVCGGVNWSSSEEVHRCEHCGKSLAPFFYFSEASAPVFSDFQLRPPLLKGEYQPIWGLTALWERAMEEERRQWE